MDAGVKRIKHPKFTKFVVLVCVFVSIAVLLFHFRNYRSVGENQFCTENANRFIRRPHGNDGLAKVTWIQNAIEASQEFYATLGDRDESHYDVLSKFSELLQSVQVEAAIIEPSILFCTLKTKQRSLLRKRNFNIASFSGSKDVITYGIMEDNVSPLRQEENRRKFRDKGFQSYFVQMPVAPWMENSTKSDAQDGSERRTSHIFYMYYKWTIHIVVFHKRNDYLWHASLGSDDDGLNFPQKKDLLFVDYDAAYENFDFIPLVTRSNTASSIRIPSNSEYFLFQMPSSRFLECNYTRAMYVQSQISSESSLEKFEKNTLIALQELKTLFNSLLLNFWIFSGTMLGWYRQCDIIPYTSDVDFAAWVSEVDDLDYVINYFRENKKLYILERMGLLEEALEFQLRIDDLRVDVFFAYKIENGSWCSGHRPSKGYYFRYYYPPYTLCSAELLRQKVQVPCETEDVIRAEYGPEWMHPVSSWNYESSIKNRGPNIYWDKKRRPKAFQEY